MDRRSVAGVDHRKDVHDFLASRRARITAAEAGLPVFDDKRRVAGLRREEVASLAGVSVDYYARLERGNLRGVSESVLDALARALRQAEAALPEHRPSTPGRDVCALTRGGSDQHTGPHRQPVRQQGEAVGTSVCYAAPSSLNRPVLGRHVGRATS